MKKSSQSKSVNATAFPEQVSVAMGEIAENTQQGLLALAVGAGLQVMQTLMEADVTALAGPKGRHDPGRKAVWHGRERGSVTLGGRRVEVSRPRVRAADGSGELPIASYSLTRSLTRHANILTTVTDQANRRPACQAHNTASEAAVTSV